MDPTQAEWQGDEGSTQRLDITLECRADGSFAIADTGGNYQYEGSDPSEVTQEFSKLMQHGRKLATGQE